MRFFADLWHTLTRHVRANLRTPFFTVFGLAQPLFWLLLFGQLFKRTAELPSFPADNYLQFFAPGVIVMNVLFGSAYAGMDVIEDITSGVLDKLLVTPVSRLALMLGNLLASFLGLAVQVLVIFGIAGLMGLRVATGLTGVLLATAIVGLLSLGLSGLSNALALLTKHHDPVIITVNFLTAPLMFVSSAMMPLQLAPTWLQTAARFNPIDYAVQAVRALVTTGYDLAAILPGVLVLSAFAALGITLATLAFRKVSD
jgi:ABC-2 type transport system permease protein